MTKNTKKSCTIDGCTGRHKALGYCNKHYLRLRTHGDPLKTERIRTNSSEESFALRTEWQGDCLTWTGSKDPKGYGRIQVARGRGKAHRYAWERVNGPIPSGMHVDHICQNPPCVNVEHLRLATIQENNFHRAGPTKGNKYSGLRNVSPHNGGWKVKVTKNGKDHYFGTFSTIEEAARVAEQARKDLFGEFAGKG